MAMWEGGWEEEEEEVAFSNIHLGDN